MMEQLSDRPVIRDGFPGLIDRGMAMLPTRFQRGAAVVPVVRLAGRNRRG